MLYRRGFAASHQADHMAYSRQVSSMPPHCQTPHQTDCCSRPGTDLQSAYQRRLGKNCTSPRSLWPLCCPKYHFQIPESQETSWHRCLQRCFVWAGTARYMLVSNQRHSCTDTMPSDINSVLHALIAFLQGIVNSATLSQSTQAGMHLCALSASCMTTKLCGPYITDLPAAKYVSSSYDCCMAPWVCT